MIKLGDKARCKVTGFTGVVESICKYLNGCTRIGILSEKLDKDGKPMDIIWLDEPQVELVISELKEKGGKNEGGPHRSVPKMDIPR